MKKNVGNTDRFVRMSLAVVLGITFMSRVLDGWVAYVALVLGAVSIVTSLLGICPLYALLGISTCPSKENGAKPKSANLNE
jgi:hypothetical protein